MRKRLASAVANLIERFTHAPVTAFKPAHGVEVRSLSDFIAETANSRPDLADVRNYNHQMIDIFGTLRTLKGKSLLDIGASPHGFALERALEVGVSYYCGVGLGVAKDVELRTNSSRAHLVNLNAEHVPTASESFDLIISLSTFEHFFHPDVVLKEMHRVLRPGGAALVSFQPIWTSARGHHLHHLPDVCPLVPPWAHLYWTPERMRASLSPSWPAGASMTVDQVVNWIYHSDEINRLDIRQLRSFFQTSPLTIEWMTPLADELTDRERAIAGELSATLPFSAEELRVKGFSALLVRNQSHE
ncbi:MAG TPA: class I SAM-dependent methyltransferase [Terracidiphilus sp.]|jgi:SAM-dependent methyltransferase|nr:class I SAM-dependent methyltransferase [Terracidiphilus sp.]